MTQTLTIAAPFTGTVVAMSHVPDVVFAQAIVGPGVAMAPPTGQLIEVVAPISGKIAALFPHAFSIEIPDGRNVLVHLGIDTVSLKGNGFTVHTSVGAQVSQGELLVGWNPETALAAGLSVVCPIVAVQGEAEDLEILAGESSIAQAGEELARWLPSTN